MIASRVGLCTTPTDAAAQVELARAAERHGFDVFRVTAEGPLLAGADAYTTVAAAAVAGSTEDIRIIVPLSLDEAASVLRIAEDVGVVDQCSGGRVEVTVRASTDPFADRLAVARAFIRRLYECPLDENDTTASGAVLPVRPGPAQPVVGVAVEESAELADALGGAVVVIGDGTARTSSSRPDDALVIGHDDVTAAAGAGVDFDTVRSFVDALRRSLARTGARTVLFEVDANASDLDATMACLGGVIAPVLSAPVEETPRMLADAWRWYQAHHAAGAGR